MCEVKGQTLRQSGESGFKRTNMDTRSLRSRAVISATDGGVVEVGCRVACRCTATVGSLNCMRFTSIS